jgi:hypothetical protein
MPPRYSYWTILAGGLPTSFRAAEREDLLPTLRRLQAKHPDAVMKWFQRGQLWESPDAARAEFQRATAPRGRDWRPGGEHRDPRAVFKKNKQERNQARRQERFARKHAPQNKDTVSKGPRPALSKGPRPEPRGTTRPEKPRGTTRPPGRRPAPRQTSRGGRRR